MTQLATQETVQPAQDLAEPPTPLVFTDSAAAKVADLIAEEGNPELKLRVFVQGGGCSGFQYGFTFDDAVNEDDTLFEKNGVTLLVDSLSFQYLVGAEIDTKKISMVHSSSSRILMRKQLAVVVLLSRLKGIRNYAG